MGGDFEANDVRFGDAAALACSLLHGVEGQWTTSARSAIGEILRILRDRDIARIHLPAYVCESVLQPVRALGIDVSFYPVRLDLKAHPDPPAGAVTLIVNYFGWENDAVTELRTDAQFSLIEDCAQALLTDLSSITSSRHFRVFSPRKFVPVPLGGWYNVTASATTAVNDAIDSLAWRGLAARLVKAAYLRNVNAAPEYATEDFYLHGLAGVEAYLDHHPLELYIPDFVVRSLAGMDWKSIAVQRRQNWKRLHERLRHLPLLLTPELTDGVVPLGYMARVSNRDEVRRALAAKRIYCPAHWPLPREVDPMRFPDAARLSESCLMLPCDQRYGPDDMDRLADAFLQVM